MYAFNKVFTIAVNKSAIAIVTVVIVAVAIGTIIIVIIIITMNTVVWNYRSKSVTSPDGSPPHPPVVPD